MSAFLATADRHIEGLERHLLALAPGDVQGRLAVQETLAGKR